MGGIGSGGYRWRTAKKTIGKMLALDIRILCRAGAFVPDKILFLEWPGEDRPAIKARIFFEEVILYYSIMGNNGRREAVEFHVKLDWTYPHFGGRRPWFVCPGHACKRRVAILYGGPYFFCRYCHNLVYESQRKCAIWRASRRARKLEKRLKWSEYKGERPKRMHRRTFERLKAKRDYFEGAALSGALQKFEQLGLWGKPFGRRGF